MKQILSNNYDELINIVLSLGEKKYRAEQIAEFLAEYKDFDEMTNLSKSFRDLLKSQYIVKVVSVSDVYESADGTKKFVLQLTDGEIIEAVLLSYKYGNTLCISTQVGCAMGCKFCVSGKNGLLRNLTTAEMVAEVLCVNNYLGGTKDNRMITNIVLMGSGEPLANYDNVVKFLRIISHPKSINISIRNITLSTCGLVEQINRLREENLGLSLTLSLHASTDTFRKKIMKVADRYSIKELFNAVRQYQEKTNRRVCFEYIMFKENTTKADVMRLKKLSEGIICFFNLIPLNYGNNTGLVAANKQERDNFLKMMLENGMTATIRRTLGEDINGACGQLIGKIKERNNRIVSVSILAIDYNDKNKLHNAVRIIEDCNADYIHLDVVDGKFAVPKSFDYSFISKNIKSKVPYDVHLMIDSPGEMIDKYIALKPKRIAIHTETQNANATISILKQIKNAGIMSGLALRPQTSIESIKDILDKNIKEQFLDYILVLSVEPGLSGQGFIEGTEDKVAKLAKLDNNITITIDGGVNISNAKVLAHCGANTFVMGNAFFNNKTPKELVQEIKHI